MSVTSMLRVAEAFVDLDRKRAQGDDLGFVERGYSRALRQAIENNDWLLEVEALKSIGDVNLETGKKTGDLGSFGYAAALYQAAIFRCRDFSVMYTLTHRVRHAEKHADQHPLTFCGRDRFWDWDENEDSNTCMSRVAGMLQDLDRQKRQGYNEDSLIDGYTMMMVEAIINMDTMVETEALKSLGDIHLERGKLKKDAEGFSRASALYNSALKRYKNEASKVALQHRIEYAGKLKRITGKGMQSRRKDKGQTDRTSRSSKLQHVTRQYDEHHLSGDTALQHGDVDSAESHFASALKQVHDPKSPRLEKEEECLRKLGNVYVQRGTQTKDGKDFAKGTALYNAAMARKGHRNQLINSIKEAERLFLSHSVGIDCEPLSYDTDIKHKNRLEEYRNKVRVQLETIHNNYNPYQYVEDDPVAKQVEIKRAEAARDLFKDISEQRKNFIKDLIEECIETIGQPPCKYAVIGLGSQATELVTPYSDLEFAILIEENKDTPENKKYFLNLTCYLYLKIINLGETILPAVAIKSLNNFYSRDPVDSWFYDSVTPRGFAFDGAMPWASKTPFGKERTKSKPAVSLIQTPERMAELQQHDIALAHGDHLSNILRYVSYLSGEQTLLDDYMARVIQELEAFNEQGSAKVGVRFARALLNDATDQHKDQELTGKLLDVKKEIYRFPTVAIVNLGLLCGVYATSVWDVIQEMKEARVVTEENAQHLQVLISISGELRLRTYVANKGQKENVSALSAMETQQDDFDETLFNSVFYLPDQKMLFRYYYTALPLKNYISGITKGLSSEFIAALGYGTLYDASSTMKANIFVELLQFKAAISYTDDALRELEEKKGAGTWAAGQVMNLISTASLLDWKATSYSNLGDDRKAINYYEQELQVQQQMYGHSTKHEDIALTYNNLGRAWGRLGDQTKSLGYHEQALAMWKTLLGEDAVDPRIAGSLNNIGAEWLALGNHDKAIGYFESGLSMLKTLHGAGTAHPDIATSLTNLGLCFGERNEYAKAITYHEQALQMEKSIYGQGTAHPDISKSLVNIGNAWARGPNDFSKAMHFYEQAIKMDKVIYGNDTAHPDIAASLNNLGTVWRHLGDHTKAISYCEQALQMQQTLHGGDNACHPDIARALGTLGNVWCNVGDKDKALTFKTEALKMRQEFYGQNTPHCDTALSLANMGTTLEECGDIYKAIHYYEEALEMMEKALGKTKEHPDIATLLSGLGSAWRNVGEYRKSIRYYERALKVNKGLYGRDAVHHSIAESLSDLAAAYQNLGDYKKAMKLYKGALNMKKTIHGATKAHSDILMLLNNLGTVCNDLGDHTNAIIYHEQALALKKRSYGEGIPHKDIAISLRNLGVAWSVLGNHRKAITYLDQALEMDQTLYGPDTDHPDIASCLTNLGAAWVGLGDHVKASRLYENALKMMKAIYGANTAHPDITATLNNLGIVWKDLGDHHKAIEYYKETLKMTEEIHGNTTMHPDIARVLYNLGNSCIGVGDYKSAVTYHQRSLKIRRYIFGHDTPHESVTKSLTNLGVAWDLMGNHRKAVEYHEKALRMKKALHGEYAALPSIAGSLRNLSLAWGNLGDQEKSRYYKELADGMGEMMN